VAGVPHLLWITASHWSDHAKSAKELHQLGVGAWCTFIAQSVFFRSTGRLWIVCELHAGRLPPNLSAPVFARALPDENTSPQSGLAEPPLLSAIPPQSGLFW
jgi:hypothetical protein